MATSSIFADFSPKDKKTARAFVKALEESAKNPRPHPTTPFRYMTAPEEIRRFAEHNLKQNKRD